MEDDVVITDINTILELKEELGIYVNSQIQDFILKTGRCPKIRVTELKMPISCGEYKTVELEFILEL